MKASNFVSVDPSFVQSPTNPLVVTYSFSGDATENGVDLASAGELPAGVLNFYSSGILECAINVGGSTSGGKCTVTYPALGTYPVVTEYIPTGARPVTQTDQETIQPYATTTTLTCSPTTASDPWGDGGATAGTAALCQASVVDQSGNQLSPTPDQLRWTVTDVTLGQSYAFTGTSNDGVADSVVLGLDNFGNYFWNVAPLGLMPDMTNSDWEGTAPRVGIHDQFELQASFVPGGAPYTGSASPAVTIALTPTGCNAVDDGPLCTTGIEPLTGVSPL